MGDVFETSLDDYGALTVPRPEGEPIYDLRAILRFQEETGTKPEEMTDEILKQFIVGQWDLVLPDQAGNIKS